MELGGCRWPLDSGFDAAFQAGRKRHRQGELLVPSSAELSQPGLLEGRIGVYCAETSFQAPPTFPATNVDRNENARDWPSITWL
jgi:hypothetical protein